ncbi:MAG: protein translocase subunit SecF [Bacteroidetes bacterium]|jgi:preprotein translocase SecF subunit|nr:protein translocase subunit SecF [Bacteroidota bacterium]
MRWFEEANYPLVSNRKIGYAISGVLLTVAILSLAFRGLELGIDFLGGMEFIVQTEEQLNSVEVRGTLGDALGAEPEVRSFGGDALLIRTAVEGEISEVQELIMGTLTEAYPNANPVLEGTDVVGPRFAADLQQGAIYSVLGALLVIFLYILIRFEWRFGVGSVAALFHDVIIVLGLFSLLQGIVPFSVQIDQAIIAAFLTIVGYSLNDTVVVFDRIREFANLFKTDPYEDIVNRSINATLSRTIVTSVTTLLVVTVLFIFGGEVLRGFSFALICGVVIGTYSSVFVASPVVVELNLRRIQAQQAAR